MSRISSSKASSRSCTASCTASSDHSSSLGTVYAICKNLYAAPLGLCALLLFTQHFRAGLNNSAPLGLGPHVYAVNHIPMLCIRDLISTAEGGCAHTIRPKPAGLLYR